MSYASQVEPRDRERHERQEDAMMPGRKRDLVDEGCVDRMFGDRSSDKFLPVVNEREEVGVRERLHRREEDLFSAPQGWKRIDHKCDT
jgi:hypothetical protein